MVSTVNKSGTKSKSGFSPPCFQYNIFAYTAFFCFPNHIWNWKHLTNSKVEGKYVFWHVILISYLCNTLCKFFIEIKSNSCICKTYSEFESLWPTNSSKEKIVLSRDSKGLFAQRLVKVFDQNWKNVEAQNQRTGNPADFTVPW